MSQVQEAEKAPTNERPNQDNDTTPKRSAKEELAFRALCIALTRAGYVGDDFVAMNPERDYVSIEDERKIILENCMDALRKSGLLSESPDDVIRSVEPDAAVNIEYCVHRIANRHLNRDQADRIAAAIVAEFGGRLDRRAYRAEPGRFPAFANLKVALSDNIEVNLFYDTPDKEA